MIEINPSLQIHRQHKRYCGVRPRVGDLHPGHRLPIQTPSLSSIPGFALVVNNKHALASKIVIGTMRKGLFLLCSKPFGVIVDAQQAELRQCIAASKESKSLSTAQPARYRVCADPNFISNR